MYFPSEDMKINRFKVVAIPRPLEYMARFGGANMPSSMYSGDDVAPLPRQKVDMLADAEAYDSMMQKVELEKSGDES